MEELVRDLDHLDPTGTVPSAVHGPETSSTLMREMKREIPFDELSKAIVRGYSETLGATRERNLTDEEVAHAARVGKELQSIHWLRRVADPSKYNRTARVAAQLGQIEASLGVSEDNRILRLMLSGDFIANSPAIADLEAAIEGQGHDLIAISNAVTKVFAGDRNFILGLGELSNLVSLIANAQ